MTELVYYDLTQVVSLINALKTRLAILSGYKTLLPHTKDPSQTTCNLFDEMESF